MFSRSIIRNTDFILIRWRVKYYRQCIDMTGSVRQPDLHELHCVRGAFIDTALALTQRPQTYCDHVVSEVGSERERRQPASDLAACLTVDFAADLFGDGRYFTKEELLESTCLLFGVMDVG